MNMEEKAHRGKALGKGKKITALLLTNSLLNEAWNSLNKTCNLGPVLSR